MNVDSRAFQNLSFYVQLLVGAAIGAASVVFFLGPAEIAPMGLSGMAIILNSVFGTPIGVVIILANIPIMVLGYRLLPGGWYMVGNTMLTVIVYSILIDVLTTSFPTEGFSDDRLLNGIFGAMLLGISGGIVYRTGTNFGGTGTLALIIRRKFGQPLSTTTLYTDAVVLLAAGATFGVEGALYAIVVLFLANAVTDYVMEGPAVIRTAFIITEKPKLISKALMENLYVGVTKIDGQGMYSGQAKAILYVTVSRAQTPDLRNIVTEIDDKSFLVIGQGHAAYGGGFKHHRKAWSGIKPVIPTEEEAEALPPVHDHLQHSYEHSQSAQPEPD